MTARVYWKPKDCAVAVPFQELGHAGDGAWGLVEDAAWMATPGTGCLELLYKSQAEYSHAMRRLPAPEIALAVQHRRKIFWKRIEQESTSLMQDAIWDCISSTGSDEAGFLARGKLVSLHASFIHARIFASLPPDEWASKLIYEETMLIAELRSPSLRPAGASDRAKEERATRRKFVAELGELTAATDGDSQFYWPHRNAQRVYAVKATAAQLQLMARLGAEGDTRVKWRDSLLMPLFDKQAKERRDHPRPVLATRGELFAAMSLLSPAQFDVEIEEKLASPDFHARLRSLRITMASLREAARMLTLSDKKLNAVLVGQIEVELRGLADWMRRTQASPSSPTLALTLEDSIAFLNLLAAMFLAMKNTRAAAEARMVASGLGKVLEEP